MEKKQYDRKKKTLEQEESNASIFPWNIREKGKATKILKDHCLTIKQKKHRALKIGAVTLAFFLGIGLFSLKIAAGYNNTPPATNPHTTDNNFNSNGNDFDIDENGQIENDKMTEQEKKLLSENLGQQLLNDATSRNKDVSSISNLISISLLPYNLRPGKNESNKYRLSILFSDNGTLYALDYLTGKPFESKSESSKDIVADFINYLGYDCAISSCKNMSLGGQKLQSVLGKDVIFVGDAYKGYMESGDRAYFIPVYESAGTGKVYYAWTSPIDGRNEDPMDRLHEELTDPAGNKLFGSESFVSDPSSQNVMKIIDSNLQFQSDKNQESTLSR